MSNRMSIKVVALALAVPLLASACSNGAGTRAATRAVSRKLAARPPSLTVTPAVNSRKVPVTLAIAAVVSDGYVRSVTLTDPSGAAVSGAFHGSDWVPAASLDFGTHYTATVVAAGADGGTSTVTTSFTTMAKPTTKPITASVNLTDGATYGVGMPIVLDFSTAIPTADRASVERRLFVQATPAQLGIWSWQSPTEVVYRPRNYWRTGSTVSLRAALAGMPVGDRVIAADKVAAFTIGPDLEYTVSDTEHTLTVVSDGVVLHRYPVSLGKSSTKSWSGNFVIMQRYYYTVFDTLGEPGGGYRVGVNYAERITWSGTFIHAAPWSVYAQGHYDVSHGCVNVAPTNAAWIYQNSHIGDPVSIVGTGRQVANGNGWTAWNMSWADFVKGSALEYPPSASIVGTPTV